MESLSSCIASWSLSVESLLFIADLKERNLFDFDKDNLKGDQDRQKVPHNGTLLWYTYNWFDDEDKKYNEGQKGTWLSVWYNLDWN